MPINIANIPKALLYFLIGAIGMYLTWELLPLIFDTLSTIGDVDITGLIPIMWFGTIIIEVIIVIGLPTWILFEEE